MQERIGASVVAGLMAGLVFGVIMEAAPAPAPAGHMMAMIGQILIGSPNIPVGWIFHFGYSALLGALFGWLVAGRDQDPLAGLRWGAAYGVVLWIAGGLIMIPVLLGMPPFAPIVRPALRAVALISLVGHLVFGVILGVLVGTFSRIPGRAGSW